MTTPLSIVLSRTVDIKARIMLHVDFFIPPPQSLFLALFSLHCLFFHRLSELGSSTFIPRLQLDA
jgi:hypothetical protein